MKYFINVRTDKFNSLETFCGYLCFPLYHFLFVDLCQSIITVQWRKKMISSGGANAL